MASSRAIEAARAFVRIYADDSKLKATLAGIPGQLSSAAKDFSGVGAAAGVGTAAIGAMGLAAISLAANAERTAVSLEVMLGSADKARAMIAALTAKAAESPFGTTDFTQAAQTLLNFGVAAESVLPTISMLGDVAAGDAEKLSRLTLVFGQMSATGRLMGQDLNQMVSAGFNPLQEISQRTGESMASLKKRMEAGGVSAQEVAKAFETATGAGGRFGGMTDRISKTTIGVWMTLKDEIALLAIDVGQTLLPAVNAVLRVTRAVVGAFSGWGKWIAYAGVAAVALVGTLAALVAASLAYVKALVLVQAFSGPKGWAMLAAGAAVAALAVGAVAYATKDMAVAAGKAHPQMKGMSGELADIATNGPQAANGLDSVADAAKHVEQVLDGMKSPIEKAVDATKEFEAALAKAGTHGMILQGNPMVAAFLEQESGFTSMLADVNKEIAILSGNATEAGMKIAEMMAAGVDPEKLAQLQALTKKRDELLKSQEDANYWKQRQEDMKQAAEEVRASLRTVEESFAMEKQRLGELVSAGALSQAEADAALKKNPAFAKMNAQGITDSMRGSTGPAQDLRSVAGAGQLTGLINGQRDIQQKQLSLTQAMRDELRQIRRNGERGEQVVKV